MPAGWIALLLFAQDVPPPPKKPAFPAHYAAEATTCPVGGEKFDAPALMHYSTFGALPDGQPIGSINFPRLIPECPGNGLVLYEDFTPETVARLEPLVLGDAYQAMRARETAYYRAYWLANALGDGEGAMWLLLSATWEAKNAREAERAQAYNRLFVDGVASLPADPKRLKSVVLRLRAANALRELGRFEEAEALRKAIAIAPDARSEDDDAEDAKDNRQYWQRVRTSLAAPIARHDALRSPVDMIGDDEAAWRCLSKHVAEHFKQEAPPPLTAFEKQYCARPELADELAQVQSNLKN